MLWCLWPEFEFRQRGKFLALLFFCRGSLIHCKNNLLNEVVMVMWATINGDIASKRVLGQLQNKWVYYREVLLPASPEDWVKVLLSHFHFNFLYKLFVLMYSSVVCPSVPRIGGRYSCFPIFVGWKGVKQKRCCLNLKFYTIKFV